MKIKNSKDELNEINLIKAHYIGILDERNSLTAYTMNDVNRLCDMIEIRNALVKDIKKRGVNTSYNNGGGQTGTRQNDSIKLLESYEQNIQKLKAIIEGYKDATVKKYNSYGNATYCDFRKYENYFTNATISKFRDNKEQLFIDTSILKFCNDLGISNDVANGYIEQLHDNKLSLEDAIEVLKNKEKQLSEYQNIDADQLAYAIWLNDKTNDDEDIKEIEETFLESHDDIDELYKLKDIPENKTRLENLHYYEFIQDDASEQFKKLFKKKEYSDYSEGIIDHRVELWKDYKINGLLTNDKWC